MISFSELNTREDICSLAEKLSAKLNSEEGEYLLSLMKEMEETRAKDIEFAYTVDDFCLFVRVFDFGRYSFIFPVELSERADIKKAIDKCAEYAAREEIEIIFNEVPLEYLPLFFEKYRHLNIDATDPQGDSFRVRIKTECELIDNISEFLYKGIRAGKLLPENDEDYARLSKDYETNKYWGYNFKDDFPDNVSDSFFRENAELEFSRGKSISLALSIHGKLIGEAVLYAFLGDGSAEFAIRLLPEWRGKGLGYLAFDAIRIYATSIGLTELRAFVDKRNTASLSLCETLMEKAEESDERVKFYFKLFSSHTFSLE